MFQKIAIGSLVLSLVGSFALAGGYKVQSISDVSSMQLRADGQYNVICKNGDFEIVSSADVAANNVCPFVAPLPPPPPVVEILEGTYRDPSGALCDQKLHATYTDGVLAAVRLDFPGCNGDFLEATCEGEICKGRTFGYDIMVNITNNNRYVWTAAGLNPTTFERIGDLNVQSPKRIRKTGSNKPGQ